MGKRERENYKRLNPLSLSSFDAAVVESLERCFEREERERERKLDLFKLLLLRGEARFPCVFLSGRQALRRVPCLFARFPLPCSVFSPVFLKGRARRDKKNGYAATLTAAILAAK